MLTSAEPGPTEVETSRGDGNQADGSEAPVTPPFQDEGKQQQEDQWECTAEEWAAWHKWEKPSVVFSPHQQAVEKER